MLSVHPGIVFKIAVKTEGPGANPGLHYRGTAGVSPVLIAGSFTGVRRLL
jgi:hypothetical protein